MTEQPTSEQLRGMLEEAAPFLRQLASQCEACEGSGEIQLTNDTSEPCVHCLDLWDLIVRIEPPPIRTPVLPPVEDQDDDIAF